MFFALEAYSNVEVVSSKLTFAGEIVAINAVLVSHPRESCNSRVNLDSLYGI